MRAYLTLGVTLALVIFCFSARASDLRVKFMEWRHHRARSWWGSMTVKITFGQQSRMPGN